MPTLDTLQIIISRYKFESAKEVYPMPGPITHLIVQQRLGAAIQKEMGNNEHSTLLMSDPGNPYTALGSMGPDFLFFSTTEYGQPLDDLTLGLYAVYDAMRPFMDFYDATIEPVKNTIENQLIQLDEEAFNGLFSDIGQTVDQISNTLLTAVEALITSQVDLFYPFYPRIQQGYAETDWFWFDFLHYRRTGTFCSNMWNLSQNDPDLKRYTLGYASHIATDVVGHSFINAIVGGPYRTHWHRHKIVENWVDAYARNFYNDDPGTLKALHLTAHDNHVPNSISGSYYGRLCEFPGGDMPDKLSAMLHNALQMTYNNIAHPPLLNETELKASYKMWQTWFSYATINGAAAKPDPVPPPGSNVAPLVNDYMNGIPPSPNVNLSSGSSFNINNILETIVEFVEWAIETVQYTVEWIIDKALELLALAWDLFLDTLRWLLYQIQKGIWEIYNNLRWAMVLGGYFFPEPEDLVKQPYADAFLIPSKSHLTGGEPPQFFEMYPRLEEIHNMMGPMEHHLTSPGTFNEVPYAEPTPMPFRILYPDAFISQSYTYNPNVEKLYDCIDPYGNNDQYTHFVNTNTWNTAQFGSAIDFSARLIAQRLSKLPNFNLDADRGYGWKTWRPLTGTISDPLNVEYVDP